MGAGKRISPVASEPRILQVEVDSIRLVELALSTPPAVVGTCIPLEVLEQRPSEGEERTYKLPEAAGISQLLEASLRKCSSSFCTASI